MKLGRGEQTGSRRESEMKGYLQSGVALVSLGPNSISPTVPTTCIYPNPTFATDGAGAMRKLASAFRSGHGILPAVLVGLGT